jgi:hypothetical protein
MRLPLVNTQILEVSATTYILLVIIGDHNIMEHRNVEKCLYKIEERVIALQANQYHLFNNIHSKMDNLLQTIDIACTENTVLCKAYHTSREETAALKAAVDTLMKKLNNSITISAPPLLGTMTSYTVIEEIMMQLSYIQTDIQDILDAICNPPCNRKQYISR